MIVKLTIHAQERINTRFEGDIHFCTKFKWVLKMIKRKQVLEYPGKRPNTIETVYDHVKFIYQKIGNERKLITSYPV